MNTSSRRNAPRFRSCIALAALVIWVLALAPAPAKAQGSVAGDKAALEKLYDSTNGDSWTGSTNWKSNMPLNNWLGVTANAAGRVTSISLNNNNLTGTLPAELEDLTELQTLTINGNTGLGGSIPKELGNLPKLSSISFNGNDLDGAIPKELANLPLTWLVLDGNDLSGAIPKELGSLDMLTTLGLGDNELTGAIPAELGDLGDTLTLLRLQGNSGLTGCVPHQLREVAIANIGNRPFCTIPTLVLTPSSIAEGGMTTVTATLNINAPSEVTLTVSAAPVAPAEAGDFTLSDNRTLTIAMGQTTSTGVVTITAVDNDEQSSAVKMVTVSAMTTSSANVPDPDSEMLTITDDDRPRGIEADRAALKAFYAATGGNGWTMRDRWNDIDTLTDFNDLDRVSAYPDNHPRKGRVNKLDFSSNNLVGSLPAELADLTELRDLFIIGNTGLTGPIPAELGTLPNLREINFRDNGLTGPIPAELGDLPKLEQGLLLNGNDLTGPIPAELGKLDKLLSLQLHDNELSGDVPAELGDLADTLNVLRLRPGNSGLGCVPRDLRSVNTIEIGDLEYCASADRVALRAFYDATNGDTWGNNTNWKSEELLGTWHGVTTNSDGRVTSLVLRENLVSGSLPPELGELSELTVLRLDVNPRMTGEIPAELGKLPKLTVLQLNRNGLSGSIPLELGELGDTLETLLLTGNMPGLTGCVPYRLRNVATNDYEAAGLTDICVPTTERVMGEPGETVSYFIGEHMVTVDATNWSPANTGSRAAEFRFPETLTADLTLTLGPAPDNQQLPDEDEFMLGMEDARTLVDITAMPNPVPGGVEVCLPVTEALSEEAGSRQLLVLRYSGTVWEEASGSHRRDGDLVCASGVTAFSPFAVGYVPSSEPEIRDGKVILEVVPGGTALYFIGEARITLDAMNWSHADMGSSAEFRLPDSLIGDLTLRDLRLTLGPVPDAQPLPSEDEFVLGMDPASRTLVDITAHPDGSVPEGGMEVCLPVTDELSREAGNRDLLLLRYDGTWRTAGSPGDVEGDGNSRLLCASGVTVFSPFAVGYVAPALSEQEVEDVAVVLSAVARTLASDAVDVVGGRFDGSPAGGGQMTLAGHALRLSGGSLPDGREPGPGTWRRGGAAFGGGPVRAHLGGGWRFDPMGEEAAWRGAEASGLSERDLLTGSSFELPLSASGGADGGPSWTVWGRGAASGFGGEPEPGFSLDGNLYGGYLGVEMRPRSSALLGLALSLSQGTVDYERTGAAGHDRTDAEIDVNLTGVLPYAHWRPREGLGLWGLLGLGAGEMEFGRAGGDEALTMDLTSFLGAVGGRQELTTWREMGLAVKADAFTTTVDSKEVEEEDVPAMSGDAVRVRMLMEGRREWAMGADSRLSPRVELGGRWDGGTAEGGLGVELGGGLSYTQAAVGLSVEARGRYLVASSLDEWGASVDASLDPGVVGRGASLTVAPVWGQASSGTERLWGDAGGLDPFGGGGSQVAGWTPQQLDVALEYGLPLSWERGRVTPYGGMTLGSSDAARYRLGSRLTVGPSLALSVQGDRTERARTPASHGVSARLGLRW